METFIEPIKHIINSPFILFIILVFLSAVVAKIADWIISSILKNVVSKTKTNVDDAIISTLHKPIYYSIFFFGLSISLKSLEFSESITFSFQAIFKSVAIFIWAIAVFKILKLVIGWYSKQSQSNRLIQKRTIPLFDNLGKMLIFIAAVYFIFLSWDIDVTALLASASIIGLVLSFAAKDTLSNLFAGIFIMADAPYKEGDYINLDTGERGYVLSIGIRSTRIMTRDDIEITIPNAVIANSKIVNESGGPKEKERIRIPISVAYGSDIKQVKRVLLDIALESEMTCKTPEPRVRFRQFGDSGLMFQLLFWIDKPEMRGLVIDEISTSIYEEFNKEQINIPFPHRTIHIQNPQNEN